MYYTDEPEHIVMLRATIRKFIEKEMPREKVRAWDKARHFPKDVFQKLAALGVCGLTVNEEYGGVGRDLIAAIMVIEELCRRGTSLGGPYIHCAFYGGINISESGTDAQKKELLPKLANGEMLFSYGLSEPNVGGDLPSITTKAVLSEDGKTVTINGVKRWCTAAEISDYIYCLVKSDLMAPKYKNLSFVLIPTNATGITIERIEHIGLGYAHTTDVTFDNVIIPYEYVVGGDAGWNNGWPMLAGPALDVEKLELTAMALGIAGAAVEDAVAYAKGREQFGKPIAQFQAINHALANAETKLAACRHMLYHAAWLADNYRPCSIETSMAKLFVTETATEIVLECQKVMGAYGCAHEYDMQRYVQDILLMPIIGGSSNMMLNNIAKRMRIF